MTPRNLNRFGRPMIGINHWTVELQRCASTSVRSIWPCGTTRVKNLGAKANGMRTVAHVDFFLRRNADEHGHVRVPVHSNRCPKHGSQCEPALKVKR